MSGVSQFEFEWSKHNGTIQERFELFDRENPNIYLLFVRFSRQAKASGRKRYSINAIFERVRWHVNIETASADDFKLNNDFRSRYARLIMEREPELIDFFEIRELKAQ